MPAIGLNSDQLVRSKKVNNTPRSHYSYRDKAGCDQILSRFVGRDDVAFHRLPAFQDRANITPQVAGLEMTYDVGERPAPVGRDQIEDCGDRRSETADDQVAVEQNRSDLSALEQVAQIRVGAVEFVDLAVEFGINRVQLFVDRLQLLLGGLQLLVGGGLTDTRHQPAYRRSPSSQSAEKARRPERRRSRA